MDKYDRPEFLAPTLDALMNEQSYRVFSYLGKNDISIEEEIAAGVGVDNPRESLSALELGGLAKNTVGIGKTPEGKVGFGNSKWNLTILGEQLYAIIESYFNDKTIEIEIPAGVKKLSVLGINITLLEEKAK